MTWFLQAYQSLTSLIGGHFFNPAFVLPGAALIASPVVIHLINRLRYRRVRFAAMEFLLKSQRRNRRRVMMEQLLLLLLRILIVLLLLALIARLILDPNQLSIFRGAAKAHHVVLLDDSGSMQNRWGETSAFNEAIDVVKQLAAEGSRRPDTQKFTLLLLSDPDQPVFVERDVNEEFVAELETKLENLRRRCTHRALDLMAGLEAAERIFSEQKATIRHLHVISDYRKIDWQNQGALGSLVRRLDAAGVAVNLVKTVPHRDENLAISDLSGDLQVSAAGVPLRLKIAVKNVGEQVARDVRISIVQDGQKLPLAIHFDKIEGGAEVTREFDVTFDSPKKHKLEAALEADSLETDNRRFLAIDIAETNPVLIVDGDPSGDEASYIADALSAAPGLTGITPSIETPDYLRRHPLDRFQCIYMVNVPELPEDSIQLLSDYVEAGGGLAWFVGDAVNTAFYNEKLYREGTGLFPVPLSAAKKQLPPADETTPGPDLNFASHPIFRIFEGEENSFVKIVKIATYLPVMESWVRDDNRRADRVATIAVMRNKDPLMFEHRYGKGRVFTSLTSAGPLWTSWPRNRSYPIVQLELQKFLARNDRALDLRVVGEPIDLSLDPTVYTEAVEIASPEEANQGLTRLKAAPERTPEDEAAGADAARKAIKRPGVAETVAPYRAVFRETDRPGVYTIKLLDKDQITHEQWVAYNVPIKESELALATTADLRRQIGEDVNVQIQEPGDPAWIQGKEAGQEVRERLLILLMIVLFAEQMLAYRLSYHPKTAGAAAKTAGVAA